MSQAGSFSGSGGGGVTQTYPITPYVVGPVNLAGYQTIQSAINAANAAGGGNVFIQPGTYTENLTLYNKIYLWGHPREQDTQVGALGDVLSVILAGSITLNTSAVGTATFTSVEGISISPPTGNAVIFTSNPAFPQALDFTGCNITINQLNSNIFFVDGSPILNLNGCNIPLPAVACSIIKYSGASPIASIYANGSRILANSDVACSITTADFILGITLNDCVYGATFDMSTASLGYITLNAYNCIFDWVGASLPLINCGAEACLVNVNNSVVESAPSGFVSATTLFFSDSNIYNTRFSDYFDILTNCVDNYYNCTFSQGIAMNSAQPIDMTDCTIITNSSPALDGTGAGTISLSNVTFPLDGTIAGTVTAAYSGTTRLGTTIIKGYTMPTADGTVGQVIRTNGSGVLSFDSPVFSPLPITSVTTSPYAVLSTDYFLAVTTSSIAITVQLPNAPATGTSFIIKDATSTAFTNNLTVTTVGGVVLIDQAATFVMATNGQSVNLVFNGTKYLVF